MADTMELFCFGKRDEVYGAVLMWDPAWDDPLSFSIAEGVIPLVSERIREMLGG